MGQGWFTEVSLKISSEKAQSMSYAAWHVCTWESAFIWNIRPSVQPVAYRLRGIFSKDVQDRVSCGYSPLNYLTQTLLA